jgi:hypothetical protein
VVRAIGIPAALVVLVGLPSAINAAAPKPEPAAEPAKGALTVRLEGDEGGTEPAYIRVAAPSPTPNRPIELADTEGLRTASATSSGAPKCESVPIRYAGLAKGPDPWCLQLDSVDTGYELKGTTSGTPELALTVTRRPQFMKRPLVVVILGLICGILVLVVPVWLRSFVKETLLQRLLARNASAPPEQHFDDLDEWVKARREAGKKAAAIVDLLDPVVTYGPGQARAKRAALMDAVAASALPAGHPYLAEARRIGGATTHNVGDFIDPEGKTQPHPAETWQTGLERLDEVQRALADEQTRIETTIKDKGDCRTKPLRKLQSARSDLNRVARYQDVGKLDKPLAELQEAIDDAAEDPQCTAGVAEVASAVDGLKDLVWPSGEKLPEPVRRRVAVALTLTLLACLVVGAFAIANLYATIYIPKPAFGTCADYFALFTAALGSGAATAVLGFLGYWQPGDEEPA